MALSYPHQRRIVVGVDGSASALHAVRWAAATAAAQHLALRLVHGHVSIPFRYPALVPGPVDADAPLVAQARDWLAEAVEAAREVDPKLEVETDLRFAAGIPVLIEHSRDARMVVLGDRGLGTFAGLLLGSTAVALAAHGHCPVVVVRGVTENDPPPAEGPIVVGVDGSASSDAAIGFAFELASQRGAELVAVHTWLDVVVASELEVEALRLEPRVIAQEAHRVLAERLAGWSEKYADVPVRRMVNPDRPEQTLLRAAEGAQLLVVGSRGRGGFAGMLLGSTSQTVLYQAHCPVAIVRQPD